jgi:2-polyprenyl-3-methyl-5-hydroxy-6-metoxy-1,4-benzoquinol methylase
MKFDMQTIEFYNTNAKKYSSYSYLHEKDELYQKFLNYLPEKSSILDAGCGAGWDTKFFLSNGYFVTALDASLKLLELVETHKNLTKINSDFLDFKSETIFEGIWASFSLQHLPKKNFKPALKLLKNSLSETGFFYIGIHEGNKEIRDTLGRYYSYYAESEIREIIQSLNLKIFSLDKLESKSFDGKKINTMHLLIEKNN